MTNDENRVPCRPPVLIAGLSFYLVAAGCGMQAAAPHGDAEKFATASSIPKVTTIKPIRAALRRITDQPGRVEAFEDAPLFAKIPGYVRKVHVDIGDKVKAGQVLVDLAVPELSDELKQKEALLAQSRAEVLQARASERASVAKAATAEAAILQAQAGVDRAEANFLRYQDELARIEELTRTKAVTPKLADETRSAFRAADAGRREAEANVASARARLLESQSHVEKAKADVVAAEARVAVAEANVKHVRTMLDYTTIRAPFAGAITARNVHAGHFIPAGAAGAGSPLLTVSKTDLVRVSLDVPENEAMYTHPGDRAELRVQALGGRKFTGKVSRTGSSLNASNRTLRTEIDVANENGALLPGMYVLASLTVAEQADALVLPVSAVWSARDGTPYCFLISAGRLSKREIKLGLEAAGQVEVSSGLTGTEDVVKALAPGFVDGQPAEAAPFKTN